MYQWRLSLTVWILSKWFSCRNYCQKVKIWKICIFKYSKEMYWRCNKVLLPYIRKFLVCTIIFSFNWLLYFSFVCGYFLLFFSFFLILFLWFAKTFFCLISFKCFRSFLVFLYSELMKAGSLGENSIFCTSTGLKIKVFLFIRIE